MVIRRNTVFGNINKIPYYNSNYDDPQYLIDNQMHVAREYYGSSNQTFIIDGSGVYVTRNSNSYLYGRFQLSENVCFDNGINGLVVHKTNRVYVRNNVLYDNGQVPKTAPQLRQAYAGLTLNHAKNVSLSGNAVTANADDYACAPRKCRVAVYEHNICIGGRLQPTRGGRWLVSPSCSLRGVSAPLVWPQMCVTPARRSTLGR